MTSLQPSIHCKLVSIMSVVYSLTHIHLYTYTTMPYTLIKRWNCQYLFKIQSRVDFSPKVKNGLPVFTK